MDLNSFKPLQERARELQCIYDIEKVFTNKALDFNDVFYKVLEIIPGGWQFPTICYAVIEFEDKRFILDDLRESKWSQCSELIVDNSIVGKIKVFYSEIPFNTECFLPEEQKLLNTIAKRLSLFIFYDRLEKTVKLLSEEAIKKNEVQYLKNFNDEHWKWRLRMVQNIADKTNFEYYGLKAMYIIGSTKEAKAGPASDIDLLVHFNGTEYQKNLFKSWIDGWNHSLSEINRQKTGYKLEDGIIDLHIVTNEDIKNNTSFAVMIENINNPARLLKKIE